MSRTSDLRRLSAFLLCAALWAGCSAGEEVAHRGRSTSLIVDGGDRAAAVAALCVARRQASTDLRAAEATYERRSRQGVEITTQELQGSYSILASSLARATADVEADVAADPPRPGLAADLALLIEPMREALARLGVPTSACEN